jgi:osmotically-inducible protein OsmY
MVKIMHSFKLLLVVGYLLSATSCTSSKKSESTGQYIDDSVITTRVKAAVFAEDTLRSNQINVKTYKGTVQLSGFIDSKEDLNRAGELASSVDGVKNVKNDLIVR